jgi:hemoglobin-like flavoprotein
VRINDIHAMLQCVEEILGDKLNEQMVNTVWKQKLDVFAQVFGASEEVVMPLSHRAIRTQDLFKS